MSKKHEVTPQTVYDTLITAAQSNVSLYLSAIEVRTLGGLIQTTLEDNLRMKETLKKMEQPL